MELLKLSGNRTLNEPPLKLCIATGKQVTVRDLKSDKLNFVPIKDPINRITSLTSGCYFERSALAVAFVEEQTDILSLEIFSTEDPDRISSITGRIKIQIPKIEEPR